MLAGIITKQSKMIVALILFSLSACASTQTTTGSVNDPLESINRPIFAFNTAIDKAVLSPASAAYDENIPTPIKKGVSNFLSNLREPWTFVNDILQLKFGRATRTFSRFLVNSTIGVGGLWNPAKRAGLSRHTEDFGQTLAHWGVKGGPYVVLPFLGPSTARDSVGTVTGFFFEPVGMYARHENASSWELARTLVGAFDLRVRFRHMLDDLYTKEDPYIFARAAYLQSRGFAIRDGKRDEKAAQEEEDLFNDLEDDEEDEEAGASMNN